MINPQMTWNKARKAWSKKYRGQLYQVSARQLGMPASKAGSVLAANAWWDAKQAEIDAAAKPKDVWPRSAQIVEAIEKNIGRPIESKLDLYATLYGLVSGDEVPQWLITATLGEERVAHMEAETNAFFDRLMGEPAHPGRTVRSQIDNWLAVLRVSVNNGILSAGKYGAYQSHIGIFARWLGEGTAIDAIDAGRLEAYWAWLSQQIIERRYTAESARTIFAACKMFVGRLAENGLIPAPGNMKRLRFHVEAKSIERLALDAVRKLLTCGGSERAKLYVLLGLNCGMYQNDVADLRETEVDWIAGTIRRKRSKRKKHPSAITVTYRLWPETLALLRKFRSGTDRVLLTDRGQPLVSYHMVNGKMSHYDTVRRMVDRLFAVACVARRSFKVFKKTGASELANSPHRGEVQEYLGQAPQTLAEQRYAARDFDALDKALAWLHDRIFASNGREIP